MNNIDELSSNIYLLRPEFAVAVDEYLEKRRNYYRRRSSKRVNEKIMAAAIAFAPELLRRIPVGETIDAQLLKQQSIDLASTLVAGFIDNDLW
jgi:hypothetical protein